MIDMIEKGMDEVLKWSYNCILNSIGDNLPKLENHPPEELQDYSMYLKRTTHTRKWNFGGFITSKSNRICDKFSKIKTEVFNNVLCQYLSVAIFHVKKRFTQNCWAFYKWEWLIHVWLRTEVHTLKSERSRCINQYLNTFTTRTWSREHNPVNKTQDNNLPNMRNTT